MEPILARKLQEKNAIEIGTELEVEFKKLTMTIIIDRIDAEKHLFYGQNTKTGEYVKFPPNIIKKVNGMTISRIAKLFNLNDDGTDKKVPKKRGRKRKSELEG